MNNIDYTDDEIAILYKGNKKPLNYRDEFKVVEEVSYWQENQGFRVVSQKLMRVSGILCK